MIESCGEVIIIEVVQTFRTASIFADFIRTPIHEEYMNI